MAFPLMRLVAALPPTPQPVIDEFDVDDTIDNVLLCIDVDDVDGAAVEAATTTPTDSDDDDNDDDVVVEGD